ncbi:sulfatase [Rhodohalobacter sulfatireducens]|uniref:Sulfatase n=1 Tax=Rhodohalobacter sulfatireducens TaxID=2911366 RepID=A0ABS9KHW4_9BACT|nr:sulfatase [Rhodohalobacter sulfatireducens]MCG2590442.1 sulfatase [Rhodohalobacter sulfatireducens]
MRRAQLITVLILIFISFQIGCTNPQTEEKKPNILFFFVDDMGWQDTSVPFHEDTTELNRRYHTPNMETLADQGVKFTQAYAAAVCSPSRISLMTGMSMARHGVTNWTLYEGESPDDLYGPEDSAIIPPEWNVNGLAPEEGVPNTIVAETLPMLLKEAGYTTIHVGKGHFGAIDTPGADPLNLGFDVNIAGRASGAPGSYHGENNFSAESRGGSTVWDVPGLEKYHGQEINLTEALTREANAVIDSVVATGSPFYLYMSHYAIHSPFERDRRFYQKYADRGFSEFEATYASMIEGMDKSLGDLMAKLEELGVEENTVVVFMSDNGAPKQAPLNRPLRGHKLMVYEGGVRVPMIAKWPGITEAGREEDQYLIIEDIFPTFLEIAGITEDSFPDHTVDGKSFVPLLRNEAGADWQERPIFWHYPHIYDQPPYSSIRKGDWKLVYFHEDQSLELYNLEEDLSESNDLSDQRPEKVEELAGILTEHLRNTDADMPTLKSTGEQVPYPAELVND